MNKMFIFGQISKTLGYLAVGLSSIIRISGSVTRYVGDQISNTGRYDLNIMVDGATIKDIKNQSAAQLSKILQNMNDFGVTEVTITKIERNKNDVQSNTTSKTK